MRRVVITGLGVISSIGNNAAEVRESLRESRSGIEFLPEMQELGFKCCVGGRVKGLGVEHIPKRARQTMSRVAQYAAVAALDALGDASLPGEAIRSNRAGVIVGTSFGGISESARAESLLLRYNNPSRLGVTGIVKGMHSTVSGNLATWLGIQGRTYAVCSSFCSGLDNIGHAYELIANGGLDVCLCGAAEESTIRQVWGFVDNWGGMSSSWNDCPAKACRPYDRDREGTVLSEGAGILLLETLEHARQRGINPYAEIIGYAATNEGNDMFKPSGEGLTACLQQALQAAKGKGLQRIDYINSHGTGTKLHDALEVRVIREVFGVPSPFVSSTKALAGHALGATGALEVVFTLLMMRHGFIAPTVNLEHISADCEGVCHVQSLVPRPLEAALCFNAGLGGNNACLIFRQV